MKLNYTKYLVLQFILVFVLSIIFLPLTATAQAVLQAPGEVPIVEPLHPIEEGTRPNYSGSIQSGDSATKQEIELEKAVENPVVSLEQTQPIKKGHKLLWTVIVLIILGLIVGIWRRRRKPNNLGITAVTILLVLFSFQGLFLPTNFSQAQSLPSDGKIIQRTIVDESTVQEPITTTPGQAQATSTVLLGLGAILLVIIVVAIIGILWSRHNAPRPGKI